MAAVTWDAGLRSALQDARSATDKLFSIIRSDSWYERPIDERHRIIFYLGHLEAFDWNLIGRRALDVPSFHPAFDQLFAFGIDPDASGLPHDKPADWPRVEEVVAYSRQVRQRLDQVIDAVDEQYLNVAIEHRLMHAETLAYMLHNLPYERKVTSSSESRPDCPVPPHTSITVPAGHAVLGLAKGEAFGWDNEFPQHEVAVPAFSIGKYKVTNGEYLAFVNDGGLAPQFWTPRSGEWFYRGMFAEFPLPLSWPVYVSQEQAQAYATWSGKRLPTEVGFQRAAYANGFQPDASSDNFDFQRWDPQPVQSATANPLGIVGMIGNGWEWTSTVFQPFPGFEPFPFYPGYSADFFDGKHYVLKGASPRTAATFTRPTFRNWFRASYPYAYSTFRIVEK